MKPAGAERLVRGGLRLIRTGDRTVLWTPPRLGFGNHLYLWQRAMVEKTKGNDWRVLTDPTMTWWRPHFAAAEEVLIDRRDVRFRDRRELNVQQGYEEHFTAEENQWFCREIVLPALQPVAQPSGTVVINVRRGDYYSDPYFRGRYSFDLQEYVLAALNIAGNASPVRRVLLVSDDPDWCEVKLPAELLRVPSIRILRNADPIKHLETLVGAERLILTNSTFSYWGGYLSTALHGNNYPSVIAPRFHCRAICDGVAWQLDPRWTIVNNISGGWDG